MSAKARTFSKYSFVLMLGFLIGIVFTNRGPVQSSPVIPQAGDVLPASTTPPPEIQQIDEERRRAPEPPRGQPTVQQLEQRLNSIAGGKEKMDQAKAKAPGPALPSSATPPEEIQQMENHRRAPDPPRGQPTLQQLEERIRSMPGGADKLDRARRGQRPGVAVLPEGLRSLLRPFQAFTSYAQSGTNATPDFTHKSDHKTNLNLGLPSNVNLYGTIEYDSTPTMSYRTVYAASSLPLSDGTSTNGQVTQTVYAPVAGYYIISAKLNSSYPVKLAHYEGTTARKIVQTFAPASGYTDYPVIMNLTQGNHYFYWVPGGNHFYIQGVHFQSYP